MQAGRAEIASERRKHRRSHAEQRDHAAAGIDRRREPGLSFTQDTRTRRAYEKCRVRSEADDALCPRRVGGVTTFARCLDRVVAR